MKRYARSFALLLLAWLSVAIAQAAEPLPDTVAAVKPSIVGVGTYMATRAPADVFRGTGFVVGDGYHVITNAHVLPDSLNEARREQLVIFTGKGNKSDLRRVKIIGVDRDHDLALLKFSGKRLKPMQLKGKQKVREGERYAFTGFPIGLVLGLYPVTHEAIVAAISPRVIPQLNASRLNPTLIRRMRDPYLVYQLDATAYPGNSGSPVYRQDDGAVIGVVNSVFIKETKETVIQKPSGITYAIPVRYVRELLNKHGVKY